MRGGFIFRVLADGVRGLERLVPSSVGVEEELLGRVDGGVVFQAGAGVHPVEVDAPDVGPVVAVEDPVRVQHRHDLEHVRSGH